MNSFWATLMKKYPILSRVASDIISSPSPRELCISRNSCIVQPVLSPKTDFLPAYVMKLTVGEIIYKPPLTFSASSTLVR